MLPFFKFVHFFKNEKQDKNWRAFLHIHIDIDIKTNTLRVLQNTVLYTATLCPPPHRFYRILFPMYQLVFTHFYTNAYKLWLASHHIGRNMCWTISFFFQNPLTWVRRNDSLNARRKKITLWTSSGWSLSTGPEKSNHHTINLFILRTLHYYLSVVCSLYRFS